MGRPKGSKNRDKSIGPEAGHNSKLTDEQRKSLLLRAVDEIGPFKDEVASVVGKMRNVYKQYKADGITKKDIDLALKLTGQEGEEARADMSRILQIYEWTHPGAQAELFEDFREAAE
jgi:uncharacterized protein (UPF0335 family)